MSGAAGSLKDVASHFAFGANWAAYAASIDAVRIAEAEKSLRELCGDLHGKSFLDIGCGSGLSSLAACRLGVSRLVAFDIDSLSVDTTQAVLHAHAPQIMADVRELSVFDLSPQMFGLFDVVYSWGVLHHTGAMHEALAKAAAVVSPGGLLVVALYRRTRLCWLWRVEKRWYARASARAQSAARAIYVGLMRLAFRVTGRDFKAYVANYQSRRGMNYIHNVHDWLGGYPYESISAPEVDAVMRRLGLTELRSNTRPMSFGLFGSGCDEYVYRRTG
jgi:2-polyprenyl-6-hydroxyphenyl methylase/3-demethylubiquinone-9 3-methyltransferase